MPSDSKPAIYWCTRDLGSYLAPVGNHHFILVVQGQPKITSTMHVKWKTCKEKDFLTIGAFRAKKNGSARLLLEYNNSGDVASVEEVLDTSKVGYVWDYDLERHKLKPPGGKTEDAFLKELITRAEKYKANEANKKVDYSLVDENCACWVNSLLKACGMSKKERIAAGEFSGFDWGEEDELDASYFS